MASSGRDRDRRPTDEEYNAVMNSSHGLKFLEAYMKTAFNDEVLRFYLAVKSYRRLSGTQQDKRAIDIFKEFISPKAKTPLSISTRSVIDAVTKRINDKDISSDMFDELHRVIVYDLRHDIFPNFFKDDLYDRFLRAVQRDRLLAEIQAPPKGLAPLSSSSAPPATMGPGAAASPQSTQLKERTSSDPMAPGGLAEHTHTRSRMSRFFTDRAAVSPGVSPVARDMSRHVYMEGWLVKRGTRFGNWKRRYFILRMGMLTYYADVTDSKPLKQVPVAGVSANTVPIKKYNRPHVFEVHIPHSDRTLSLQALGDDEVKQWIKAFTEQMLAMRKQRSADRAKRNLVICHVTKAATRMGKGGGLFTAYCIRVQTSTLVWHVWRRYSEFEALHRDLKKGHAHLLTQHGIDHFPRRAFFGMRLSKSVVESRMSAFNHYLRRLVTVPDIAQSLPVMSFLGMLCTPQSQQKKDVKINNIAHVVDVGDLLLMRSKSSLASVQRAVFRSQWDHVAMVIKIPILSRSKENFCVLEAVSAGVTALPLHTRLEDCRRQGQVVALRKLKWNRSEERLVELQNFVDQAMGKKYSLKGFLMKNSNLSGFFCSELVVRCYKALGVVPAKLSSRLLPGDFSSSARSAIHLKNARLDSEIIVDFNRTELAKAVSVEMKIPSNMFDSGPASPAGDNGTTKSATAGHTRRASEMKARTADLPQLPPTSQSTTVRPRRSSSVLSLESDIEEENSLTVPEYGGASDEEEDNELELLTRQRSLSDTNAGDSDDGLEDLNAMVQPDSAGSVSSSSSSLSADKRNRILPRMPAPLVRAQSERMSRRAHIRRHSSLLVGLADDTAVSIKAARRLGLDSRPPGIHRTLSSKAAKRLGIGASGTLNLGGRTGSRKKLAAILGADVR